MAADDVRDDGIDPATIPAQRAAGWPDFHPEDYCHRCGRPNPNWYADTAEWQTATRSTGDGGGIMCPSCFAALWEQVTGRTAIIWRLSIDPRSRDARPPADEVRAIAEPTEYEVTAYPFHDINRSTWTITVARRAEDSWAVMRRGACWNRRTKAWDYEPMPSSRTDAFKRTHRFPLDQALAIAREQAERMEVMGWTIAQAIDRARAEAADGGEGR